MIKESKIIEIIHRMLAARNTLYFSAGECRQCKDKMLNK